MMEVEDFYSRDFIGTNYPVSTHEIQNISQLKSFLEEIIEDLPKDGTLEVCEFSVHDGKICYSLREGMIVDQAEIKKRTIPKSK